MGLEPDPVDTNVDAQKIKSDLKDSFSDSDKVAYHHLYTGKIGINRDNYKKLRQIKKSNFDPLLNYRKRQILQRLGKSSKFKSLPEEQKNQILTKLAHKTFVPTLRAIVTHELEHDNQYNIIKKELGNGNKIGEYKAITRASNKYKKEASRGKINGKTNFRIYGSVPLEYGANLKSRNQLTPQQSRELALYQADPKRFPLKSIRIDPDKAEYMALNPLYQLKDNRGRHYDYGKKMNKLYELVTKRMSMTRRK